MAKSGIKESVRDFYDEVGWQEVGDGLYQNAQFEDLRPVSREYIHKCHMRLNRHLGHKGKYILDAGSGPIQYPEYLTYSDGYHYRVCLDISIVALREARKRIGSHGLFVVGDVANLPFQRNSFSDVVSLHAIHHLPRKDHAKAYHELWRVLKTDGSAVVVNGWDSSWLMNLAELPMRVMERLLLKDSEPAVDKEAGSKAAGDSETPDSTYVYKQDAKALRHLLGDGFPIKIRVWRSVSVRFLRAMIHPRLLGKVWLKILFIKEELFPRLFGRIGQYPLITFRK